jgi:uncharacterized protein
MRVLDFGELRGVVAGHSYPVLFATVSGAHLYGFPSRDSDVDLRGVHLLPIEELVGLRPGPETIDRTWTQDGAVIDLVTHDTAKFFRLLLRPNGYVLEQLLSPHVVSSSPAHEELVALAPGCLTHRHAHHYRGFARTQWELHLRTGELKPLLYTMRVLLTGIHLIRTGELVAHLPTLIDRGPVAPAYLGELVAAKSEREHGVLPEALRAVTSTRTTKDVAALHAELDEAERSSPLPGRPTVEPQLHDLLVRLRTTS